MYLLAFNTLYHHSKEVDLDLNKSRRKAGYGKFTKNQLKQRHPSTRPTKSGILQFEEYFVFLIFFSYINNTIRIKKNYTDRIQYMYSVVSSS